MNAIMRRFRPEQLREMVLVLLIFLVIIFFGLQINNFFSGRTFNRITTSVAIIAVVAVGQTLVILTRNIDLSVGSIVGFTAYFTGTLLAANNELSPILAVLAAMVMGAALGGFNGVIVAYGRVPAIIVTLGTLAIYRTALVELSGAKSVLTNTLPQWLIDLPRATLLSVGDLDVRWLFVLALFVVAFFQLVLVYTRYGRRLYAIGSNPEAAKIAGFPSQRIVLLAFVLCGSLAGLAGFMFLARFGNITVVAGLGIELNSVAAAVVGGVNIFGGSGSVIGVLLGAILIDLLEQSLIRWLAVSEFVRDFLLGLLILLAVAADTVVMNRLRNAWARSGLESHSDSQEESGHVA
ncbi:MAG: ABC transporter permease [Chloroflexi bacterium]|nr:ABC transporter permease [Chloroflexota bacterium]